MLWGFVQNKGEEWMHPQRGEMEFDSIGISKLGLKGRQDIAGGRSP